MVCRYFTCTKFILWNDFMTTTWLQLTWHNFYELILWLLAKN